MSLLAYRHVVSIVMTMAVEVVLCLNAQRPSLSFSHTQISPDVGSKIAP